MTLPTTAPRLVRRGQEPVAVVCHRYGLAWQLEWVDRTALADDSVGMRHLATLIAHPGQEIPAIELATGAVLPIEGRPSAGASHQPMLDEQARTSYKQRLTRLQTGALAHAAGRRQAGEFGQVGPVAPSMPGGAGGRRLPFDRDLAYSSTRLPSPARGSAAPSIRDVAAAAGVSYQTVSRVLNDSPRVRPETRATVLDAIDRLGFRPSRAARALSLGRARAITVVTSNTVLYGYAATLQGIEEAARAAACRWASGWWSRPSPPR
ncbi:LacI family DNA-binding transcriptional regulator [Thermocatellispora tengchongensis]|uniref:LacI family DNA-binding transcriptional regulator n=1 Tax=Thermocatellispora tengchongensis TaxID=1073253 RepID=UPI00364354B6